MTLPTGARLVVGETADSKVNLFFYPSPLDRQQTLGKQTNSRLWIRLDGHWQAGKADRQKTLSKT